MGRPRPTPVIQGPSHEEASHALGTTAPPPAWFADFLRLMAQRKLNKDGELVMLSTDEFLALRSNLEAVVNAERSRYAAIARWFLSSTDERALRPGLQ